MEEDQGKEPHEPKLGFVEILIIFPFLILFDVLGMIIIFFGLDDFFIFDILNLLVNFYLAFRKVPATAYYICSAVEAIPYVGDIFPGFTIGFAMTIYFDRNPEQAKMVDQTVGKVAKLAQKSGVGGEAGAVASLGSKAMNRGQAETAKRVDQARNYGDRLGSAMGGESRSGSNTMDGPLFGEEGGEEEEYAEAA